MQRFLFAFLVVGLIVSAGATAREIQLPDLGSTRLSADQVKPSADVASRSMRPPQRRIAKGTEPILNTNATPDGGIFRVGESVEFTVIMDNVEGSVDADFPTLLIANTAGSSGEVQIQSISTTEGTCNDQSVTGEFRVFCDVADSDGFMLVGEAVTVTISAIATAEGGFIIAADGRAKNCNQACGGPGLPSYDTSRITIQSGTTVPDIDLALAKTTPSSLYALGDTFAYRLVVSHQTSTALAANFTVEDLFPPEVTLDSVSPSQNWNCTSVVTGPGGSVNCTYLGEISDTLPSEALVLNATASTVASAVANAALVRPDSMSYTDNNESNNTASATISIEPGQDAVDLSLVKTRVGSGPLIVDDAFTYTLVVTNQSNANPATAYSVQDALPAQVELLSVVAPGSDFDCANSTLGVGGTVNCVNTVSLDESETTGLQVNVRAASAGQNIVNTATVTVSPGQTDSVPGNNQDSASVDIFASASADLSVTIAADPISVPIDTQSVITVSGDNDGPFTTSEIVLTTVLPNELAFDSFAVAGSGDFSCEFSGAEVGGTVTCTEDSGAKRSPTKGSRGGPVVIVDITTTAIAPTNAASASATISDSGTTDPNLANNSASVTLVVPGPNSADLQLTATGPASVDVGAQFDYEVMIENLGPSANDAYQVSATLPAGVEFVSATATNANCSFANGVVTCDGQPAAGGTTGTGPVDSITLTVIGQTPGAAILNASVSSATDPTTANNQASVTTAIQAVVGQVDLVLAKEVAGATRSVGSVINYTLEVRNDGTISASGIQIIDDLPNGVTFRSATGAQWVCASAGRQVVCDYDGSLPPGAATRLTLVTDGPTTPGTIVNRASVSSEQEDANPANNTAEDSIRIIANDQVDLALVLEPTDNPVPVDAEFGYALSVSNNGSITATGVSVLTTFDGAQSFIESTSSNWACSPSGESVNCVLDAELNPGASEPLLLAMSSGSVPGTVTAAGRVSSSEVDASSADNSASATVRLVAEADQADLSVTQSADVTSTFTGSVVTYTLNVSNAGPSSTSATVVSQLTGLAAASAFSDGFDCSVDATMVTCASTDDLQPLESRSITVAANVTAQDGFVSNRASVSAAVFDPITDNNSSLVETPVLRPVGADVAVIIEESIDPVPAGDTVSYTLTLSNDGPDTATGVSVNLSLSEPVEVMVSGAGFTCLGSTPTLDCALNSTLGSVEPRTLVVDVVAPASGSVSLTAVATANENDPNRGNNSATEQTQVSALAAEDIEALFDGATDEDLDPFLGPLARTCARENSVLLEQCQILIDESRRGTRIDEAIDGLLPDEILTMTTALTEAQAAQFVNIDTRLNELRGGAGGFSYGGLGFRYGNENFSMALLEGEGEEPNASGSNLASPWGFFINGNVSGGDRDATTRQVGFDFDTRGVTGGVDYRLNKTSVLGLALGWAKFDSDDQFGSNLETDGFSLTGYGSFYPKERLYVDGRISYGSLDLSQRRRVTFNLGPDPIDTIARGDTSADQLTAAIGAGYHFNNGAWNISPNVTLRYQRSDVDGFTETGGGPAAFSFSDQDIDSLVVSGGLQISRVFSLTNGVITPGLDLSYHHELEDDAILVDARLLDGVRGEVFRFESDRRDSNYASVGVTLVFVSSNGKQFYANARNVLGISGFSRWTLNLGARFEF